MADDIAIKVSKVSKTFKLPHEKQSSIKGLFVSMFNGKRTYERQRVLKDVSFEIKKGEFFGIVGRNGSGKSTLLKMLAGIYSPDKGTIEVNGKLTPFIELGVGFNPDLTGRENVFLNGALLGFSREEMLTMYDEIVEFAELERFMDQKLKNYSSGMQVRLAFSIAIQANTDILVLDEVLAVGDDSFQKKCYQYFATLKRNKQTVILVTHSMDSVQQFCSRAFLIEKGDIVYSGNPAKAAQKYREMFLQESLAKNNENNKSIADATNQPLDITAKIQNNNELINISVSIDPKIDLPDSIVSLFIDRDTGEQVYRFSSDEKTGKTFDFKKGQKVTIDLGIQNIFPNGSFSLRASVKSKDRSKEYALFGSIAIFEIDRRLNGLSDWDIHWQPQEHFEVS